MPCKLPKLPHGTAVAKATLYVADWYLELSWWRQVWHQLKFTMTFYDLWTWFMQTTNKKLCALTKTSKLSLQGCDTKQENFLQHHSDRISSLWLLIYRHIRKADEEIFWSPFQCGLCFLCSFRLISSGTTSFLFAVALSSEALPLV